MHEKDPFNQPHIDQLQQHEITLGGQREGGEMLFHGDTPIDGYTREDGFKVGNLPADLLVAVEIGEAGLTFGLLKTDFYNREIEGNEPGFALVKLDTDSNGNVLGVAEDERGRTAAQRIVPGETLTYGRNKDATSSQLWRFDGREEVDGDLEDRSISGKHFSVGITPDGMIKIADEHSLNGTRIHSQEITQSKNEAVPHHEIEEVAKDAGDIAVKKSVRPDFIDFVPQNNEELKAWQESKNEAAEAERQKKIDEKAGVLQEKMVNLTADLSEADKHNLWKFAASYQNKRDAQERGDGAGSIAHEQDAGQAYRNLSPKAKEISSSYSSLMAQRSRLFEL